MAYPLITDLCPLLRILQDAVDQLLPSTSLSILEFLEFRLPIISSSKVLAPAKFFSNLDPAIMGTDPLRGMVVPSDKTLVALGEACKAAVQNQCYLLTPDPCQTKDFPCGLFHTGQRFQAFRKPGEHLG
jgi:hypothetical protein